LNHANDFEEHLQELFDEVKTLISTGKEGDAIDLLDANYQAVKEQLDAGFSGVEEAALLDIIALGYIAVGNLKMVGSLLDLVISFIPRRRFVSCSFSFLISDFILSRQILEPN